MKIKQFIPICAIILLLACTFKSVAQNSVSVYPHYNIELNIDPENRELEVKGSLELKLSDFKKDTLTFYLNRGMKISSFKLNDKIKASLDTSASDNIFMPEARKIYLDISAYSDKPKNARIDFSYQGTMKELTDIYANRIEPEWTEIGLYYPWFPFGAKQIRLFTYQVAVEAPPAYKVFGLGETKEKNGFMQLSSTVPVSDIVICLSEELKTHTSEIENNQLNIYYQTIDKQTAEDIANDISETVKQFNKLFGDKKTDISLIESLRESGGGYARITGVVLSDIDKETYRKKRQAYEKYFAHEFAHLWWHKANVYTWEDWINESFAEYSALMIIRNKYGQAAFDERIERMKTVSDGTPPIWGFDRSGESNQLVNKVLYNKGPVLLYELEKEIGQESFSNFLKYLIDNDIHTNSDLFSALETLAGKNVSETFKNKLKTR